MAKVIMNDNFPDAGGRLWLTIGGYDTDPDEYSEVDYDEQAAGGGEHIQFDNVDAGRLIEGIIHARFENPGIFDR